MKVHPGIVFMAVGMLMACSPDTGEQADGMPAAESTDMAMAEAAVDQIRTDYMAAFNNHDAATVASMFADSAVVLAANGEVEEGREAIEASLTEQMAGSPMAQIDADETMVFGDMAVQRGTYTVNSTTPDGTAMSVSGSYMSALAQADGAWMIEALITNLNAPPPEGYPMAEESTMEPPPEEGTMTDLGSAYMAAFNSGDAAAVAALYTDDAMAAFANEPVAMGTAAIQAANAASFAEGSPQLEIHDVYTQPLADGYALDAGWYTVTATTPDGEMTTGGTYVLLCRQAADGTWKIHWSVVNGNPTTT
ncbi:MAG: SgcJ/EcaC family oxidoreductase [Gemmatimonadota bacterium]|jgi:uncharacterized protein (TIGR02246 family)